MRISLLVAAFIFSIAIAQGDSPSQESATTQNQRVQERLETLNGLVGEWRGIGQVRRGSTRGAWKQMGEFLWDFSQEQPAIEYVVKDGNLTAAARITWNPSTEEYVCQLETPESTKRKYTGNWDSGKLILTSDKDNDGQLHRLTITPLNEKRTLVLHEKTSGTGTVFFRVAEVGYTRAGTRLALPGGVARECVVTGGAGTTEVSYKGETYYVCCSGCKQAFDDDPEGIIADFKARLKERLESQ